MSNLSISCDIAELINDIQQLEASIFPEQTEDIQFTLSNIKSKLKYTVETLVSVNDSLSDPPAEYEQNGASSAVIVDELTAGLEASILEKANSHISDAEARFKQSISRASSEATEAKDQANKAFELIDSISARETEFEEEVNSSLKATRDSVTDALRRESTSITTIIEKAESKSKTAIAISIVALLLALASGAFSALSYLGII